MNLAGKVEDLCLSIEADQSSQACLNNRAFSFVPGAVKRLLHELSSISMFIRIGSSSCLCALVLFEDLAQGRPPRELGGKTDCGVRRARRGQCEICQRHAPREMAVV
jgi:hypothetical protein